MKGHLRRIFGSVLVALFLSSLPTLGCETAAARAFRGARHYATGTDALALGEHARAVAELERAAELVPAASEVQNHLGLAYWAEGRRGDARVAFEAAIELDCDNRAAHRNLDRLDGFEVGTDASLVSGQGANGWVREGRKDGE